MELIERTEFVQRGFLMQKKSFILLFLLCLSIMPFAVDNSNGDHLEDVSVPEPIFDRVFPKGDDTPSVYQINETITIFYETSRTDVEGMILLGSGSNLTENLDDEDNLRYFELESSFRDESFYEIELNVTSYTYFYAMTWFNTIDNHTYEEIDFEDNALGHQLWVKDQAEYPEFVDLENAELQEGAYYAPLETNVSVIYDVLDPLNNTELLFVTANSTEDLYNRTIANTNQMVLLENRDNNVSRFIFNLTITQRLTFFTALGEFGYERDTESELVNHRITTGFNFNVSFSVEDLTYTDLDPIVFNVTSVNQTDDDEFSYRYRYFENETSDDPLLNWTEVSIMTDLIESKEVNNTIDDLNFTSEINVYRVHLDIDLNISQKLEIQAYVEYLEGSYNESDPYVIIIRDSRPDFVLLSGNNTITNANSTLVEFELTTVRGEIEAALLSSNFTSEIVIKGEINQTVKFTNVNATTIEGNHTVTISITNEFTILNITAFNETIDVQRQRNVTLIFTVDISPPLITNIVIDRSLVDSDGIVEISFMVFDERRFDSGISLIKLSWGNNLTINATGLNSARFQYYFKGEYNITITAIDKVGNKEVLNAGIVKVEMNQFIRETTTDDSPLDISNVIIPLVLGTLIVRARKLKQIRS